MRKPLGKVKDAKQARKLRRKLSARKTIVGTAERPRDCLTRSNNNLFVQVIDDSSSKTLASAQTFGKSAAGKGANKEGAKAVGTALAAKMKEKGLSNAVFDRSGNRFSSVLSSMVEAMKENGIRI